MKNENYYVFVESKVRHDYLITLFKENIFEKKIFDSLFGYKEFIKSDSNNQIIPLKEIKINDTLGFFKLLGIFKGDIVQKYSILVGVDENNKPIKPRYFGEVKSIEPIKHKIDEKFVDIIYRKGLDYVPFFMKPAKKSTITIVKKLKGYMIVKIAGKANLNGEIVDQGYFKIIFKKFDRSSRKKEFIGDKKVFEIIAKNSTNELINKFDNLV